MQLATPRDWLKHFRALEARLARFYADTGRSSTRLVGAVMFGVIKTSFVGATSLG